MDATDISARVAAQVTRLMVARQWSQAELARQLDTHPSNVGRLLTGHYAPSAKTLAALATAFEVDVCEIVCEPKERK